jgi:hypothetical protein
MDSKSRLASEKRPARMLPVELKSHRYGGLCVVRLLDFVSLFLE